MSFSQHILRRNCGKKAKTKRLGVGPWKEWLEVQQNEGQRHIGKTASECFPRAHDFPPRMGEQEGVMGHCSQRKEQCNVLVQ